MPDGALTADVSKRDGVDGDGFDGVTSVAGGRLRSIMPGADDPSNIGVMGIAESDLYSAQQGATYATKAAPYTLASQWVMSFEGSDEVSIHSFFSVTELHFFGLLSIFCPKRGQRLKRDEKR